MTLSVGARLGPYKVVSLLGSGGMGEVYRAHDTKLNRDVALKILPEAFILDGDRIARFRREAQVLASLNHPNIAAIYGFEDSGSTHALVLELVEGPTLADRIARGPIPLDEALPIARQIAEALEAAHEQGIIHRDLKPANVKVRDDGTVKVLDFGLAKAMEPAAGPRVDVTNSPTITTPAMMTGVGVILGTAAYMSPEQAKGRPADKRSDVWAFGCVLYEMLTGTRAFEGEDVSDTLAAVLRGQPDWDALPADVSPPLRLLAKRCLEKDRRKRIADLSTVLFLLNEPELAREPVTVKGSFNRRTTLLVAASFALGVLIAMIVFRARPSTIAAPVGRFAVTIGPQTQFAATGRHILAMSPDGSRLVYVANRQLYQRSLDRLQATPVRGTGGDTGSYGRSPFFSPDGKWVGFWQDNKLRKVLLDGGTPVDICDADNPYGATWSADGTIVYGEGPAGIFRVSAEGGRPDAIVRVPGSLVHGPQLLPDGRSVLFTLLKEGTSSWDDAQIVVQALDTGRRDVLIRGGTDGRYVETGHIVYVSGGTLFAVPFDLMSLRVTGGPVSLVEQVAQSSAQTGAADFSISRTGSLAYVTGTFREIISNTLVWLDRQARETPLKAPPRGYVYPRISPDGSRLAVEVREQDQNIVIWDFAHETLTPLTFGHTRNSYPVWTPDSRRIAFGAATAGEPQIWWQAADGSGAAERLTQAPGARLPTAFAPGGTHLIFHDPNNGNLMALALNEDRRVVPLVQKPNIVARNGAVSPDGRWLAYETNESGPLQVFVRPFPNVDSGRWQVSTDGGIDPAWSHDGRELFYVALTGGIMRVPVQQGSAWMSGTPHKLIDGPYRWGASQIGGRSYDVSPNGDRFLVLKPTSETLKAGSEAQPQTRPDTIVWVQNWTEELKQRVPRK